MGFKPSLKATCLLFGLLSGNVVQGQTASGTATQGDSLTATPPPTKTANIGTVTIGGTASTFSVQFTVPASADQGANIIPNIYDPQATNAQTVCPGYRASNAQRNKLGFTATLTLAGQPCNVYGTDVDVLDLTVEYQSAERLSINISPAYLSASNSSEFILSPDLVATAGVDTNADTTAQENDFQVTWSNDPTFSFSVIRQSTGDVVFDTTDSVLVFENQFVEFVSSLPEGYNLNGLGEHLTSFNLGHDFNATMFAADAGNPLDYNLYGTHPFYLDTRYYEIDGENKTLVTSNDTNINGTYESYAHGVYNRNAHAHEILLRPTNITWRTTGGSIDLYFFTGPTQVEVTKQYLAEIGLPAMQQYFTFGYHQCRWGYQNWTVMQEIVDNFRNYDIPLETIWNDIDYMAHYKDFTLDPVTFPANEAQQFLSRLHANGQHYVPIVDSAIYIPNPDNGTDRYDTYTRGHELDVFLKNPDGSEYIGSVWPGYTVFPDWQSQNGQKWWINEMTQWHNEVAFDGIWIDMSEVSSFCIGSCGTGNLSLNPVHPPFQLPGEPGNIDFGYPEGFNLTNATEAASASAASSSQAAALSSAVDTVTANAPKVTATSSTSTSYLRTSPTPGVRNLDHPPYAINHVEGDIRTHAVAPNATHQDGVLEYDVHNLFGHQILNATYQALLNVFPNKRPFIIGRSTFAGSGVWAGHWGGDNQSKWYYLYFSVTQALQMSLFGIPMFGVDTCGFSSNTDEELCNRWMQLSAFFPFYRNHNVLAARSQEPYVWASVAEATRTAMKIRYSLLPYMYTLFHLAHTTGSTVMRAVSWEFPNDPSLASVDRQFMLGPSLMVLPVLDQGVTSVSGIFPGLKDGQIWYDWYTNAPVTGVSPGQNVTIDAPLGHIPLYVRGGYILPMQEPGYTTKECRQNPWGLIVALSAEGTAKGQLYLDDGESVVPNATLTVDFTATKGKLYVSAVGEWVERNPLANMTILGVQSEPAQVMLDGETAGNIAYNSTSGALMITGLANQTSEGAFSKDWVLSWN